MVTGNADVGFSSFWHPVAMTTMESSNTILCDGFMHLGFDFGVHLRWKGGIVKEKMRSQTMFISL